MAQKMTGALVFDERTDRYDIRFDLLLIGLIFVTAISLQAPPLFPLCPLGMRSPSRLRGVLSG